MTFTIPEGLAPEIYPLAWLLGTWEGEGTVGYGRHIPASPMRQRAVFSHDGGPYLAYTSTVWLLDGDGQATQVWHTESGYWRIPPQTPSAGQGDGQLEASGDAGSPAGVSAAAGAAAGEAPRQPAGAPAPQSFPVEVLMAEPAGFVAVYLGQCVPARIDLATDIMARTESAARVDAARRMYGLVESDLLWVWDIAAFGEPMDSYMAARLVRQPESAAPQADSSAPQPEAP